VRPSVPRFTLLLGLLSACASLVFAQLNRATLTGSVADPSGAAVVNARIRATHKETNVSLSTTSTDAGLFTLPALEIGTYRVWAEAPGFKRWSGMT
jgi:hypothetical protein